VITTPLRPARSSPSWSSVKARTSRATVTPTLREIKDNFGSARTVSAISASRAGPRARTPIRPGSAAMEAGMQPGDLIVSIDGKAVEAFEDLPRIVSAALGKQLERLACSVATSG
jgi:membrane-associated protease RseP (regulator of RpoE activity)